MVDTYQSLSHYSSAETCKFLPRWTDICLQAIFKPNEITFKLNKLVYGRWSVILKLNLITPKTAKLNNFPITVI